jgi:hypothetical protein
MAKVTPRVFKAMGRQQQQQFLSTATMHEARRAGVRAVCGNCSEPVTPGDESHRCNPAHLSTT